MRVRRTYTVSLHFGTTSRDECVSAYDADGALRIARRDNPNAVAIEVRAIGSSLVLKTWGCGARRSA